MQKNEINLTIDKNYLIDAIHEGYNILVEFDAYDLTIDYFATRINYTGLYPPGVIGIAEAWDYYDFIDPDRTIDFDDIDFYGGKNFSDYYSLEEIKQIDDGFIEWINDGLREEKIIPDRYGRTGCDEIYIKINIE